MRRFLAGLGICRLDGRFPREITVIAPNDSKEGCYKHLGPLENYLGNLLTQTSTTKAEIKYPVWWGGQRELARLVALVRTLQESASSEARVALTKSQDDAREANDKRLKSLAQAIAANIERNGGDPGPFAEPRRLLEEVKVLRMLGDEVDYSRVRDVEALDLKMTVTHKSWNEKRTGSPELLTEELEVDEVVSIEMTFGQQFTADTFLRLELGKNGSRAELGGDVAWVSSAAGQLDLELRKQNSRLGKIFNGWAPSVIGGVPAVALAVLLLPSLKQQSDLPWLIAVLFLFFAFSAGLAIQKFVPRFELVRDSKPRVKAWLGAGMGVLGALVVGVVTNAVSKLVGL